MDKLEFQKNRAALKGMITMLMNQMNNMYDQLDAADHRIQNAELGGFNEGYAEGYEKGYKAGIADAISKIQEMADGEEDEELSETGSRAFARIC
ncbi:MAG: hypothetical protein IJV59_07555 [Eubacterium sp.]|nr:hypothetical protein [Eubacterium sp.]MBQ9642919.1 hypothetical protein [Lachnospiraceae bacterium]